MEREKDTVRDRVRDRDLDNRQWKRLSHQKSVDRQRQRQWYRQSQKQMQWRMCAEPSAKIEERKWSSKWRRLEIDLSGRLQPKKKKKKRKKGGNISLSCTKTKKEKKRWKHCKEKSNWPLIAPAHTKTSQIWPRGRGVRLKMPFFFAWQNDYMHIVHTVGHTLGHRAGQTNDSTDGPTQLWISKDSADHWKICFGWTSH